MKKTAYLMTALLGFSALGQAGAHAGLVNAGFETGDLTGWTATFDHGVYDGLGPLVYVQARSDLSYAGTDYAVLTPGASEGELTTLSQTFFLSKGETINGAVQFNPYYAWEYRDRALVTINGTPLFSAMDGVISTASLFKWTPYSFTAPSADRYTLTASIWRGFSSGEGVALRFDAIDPEPSAVPEPSTWAMLLIGFAGLGFAGYRRAKAGHATPVT